MVLMDFRDDYMHGTDAEREQAEKVPLFLYVMPSSATKVFVEETSLIADPPVGFGDLKERLYKRLDHLGVKVKSVLEEEFCLIPMGGKMPVRGQRILAFGGSAGLVHPSTGYMVTNMLFMSSKMAAWIADQLGDEDNTADAIAGAVWSRLWNETRTKQRDFHTFGGDFEAKRSLSELREFFNAFFSLPERLWTKFLAFELVDPVERLQYGLGIWFKTSNRIRVKLLAEGGLEGKWPLLRSVLPFAVEDDDRR
eukprot:Plantae.Rhodophyta-Rhodochaete_pulchella.ctg3890.p2 GENE.Plantae.Rhodophyta-Rhodochaete_pulchella.ctg3890~~Plantae.Rhodophyta-Rhodochaete_pulchella.ctg3890.p2  ORF type:complete len:286 (-),score=69.29 Plantae.Rhodophyta-Rhodochaete_pulchella.ctg3890:220-975(-)